MLGGEEILKRIEKNMARVRSFGVQRIGLFGSYLRGEQGPESDIDILVEFREGMKTFDNYMELKFFLEELLGCKVDLVIKEAVKPRMRPYILKGVRYVKVS